jgi:uncharacterized protein YcnI
MSMTTKLTSGARRTAVLLSAAAVSLAAAAAVAQAHVTVNPNTAQQGAYTKVSFRVPNEEKDQSTTTIEVDLPTDHPIASVSVKPVPGWTATATKSTLPTPIKTDDGDVAEAVTKIVWTGGTIDPGQFQEFDVSMGPLPKDTDQLVFKALQTYSDGNVVRWIDVPQAGQAAPDHPAPVLHLTAPGTSATATVLRHRREELRHKGRRQRHRHRRPRPGHRRPRRRRPGLRHGDRRPAPQEHRRVLTR